MKLTDVFPNMLHCSDEIQWYVFLSTKYVMPYMIKHFEWYRVCNAPWPILIDYGKDYWTIERYEYADIEYKQPEIKSKSLSFETQVQKKTRQIKEALRQMNETKKYEL
jgi:hypothetical protein